MRIKLYEHQFDGCIFQAHVRLDTRSSGLSVSHVRWVPSRMSATRPSATRVGLISTQHRKPLPACSNASVCMTWVKPAKPVYLWLIPIGKIVWLGFPYPLSPLWALSWDPCPAFFSMSEQVFLVCSCLATVSWFFSQ